MCSHLLSRRDFALLLGAGGIGLWWDWLSAIDRQQVKPGIPTSNTPFHVCEFPGCELAAVLRIGGRLFCRSHIEWGKVHFDGLA